MISITVVVAEEPPDEATRRTRYRRLALVLMIGMWGSWLWAAVLGLQP